jgi:hypothetical protein
MKRVVGLVVEHRGDDAAGRVWSWWTRPAAGGRLG